MSCQHIIKTVPDEEDGGFLVKLCGAATQPGWAVCATHEAQQWAAILGPAPYPPEPRKPLRTLRPRRAR